MENPKSLQDLDAERVYLLMNKHYRISRNRRAEWFFTHLNTFVTLPQPTIAAKLDEVSEELDIISITPKNQPMSWNEETKHSYRYRICSDTVISVISKKYRFVYCIDLSPSVAFVDVQASVVMFDGMFEALRNSMVSLIKPFYIPGSKFLFQPKIYLTIIAHSSFLALNVEQVLVQGVLLTESTCADILHRVFTKLHLIVGKVVQISTMVDKAQLDYQTSVHRVRDDPDSDALSAGSISMSADFALVDMFRHAVTALSLLPESSAAGLIVITDGANSVPDGVYLDMVLSQLRYNTVSCSFVQLSSPYHPHVCYGLLPYVDFMKFIASATSGAFITSAPCIESANHEMNAYHETLLLWNFQTSRSLLKNPFLQNHKSQVWSIRNKCFRTIRDMPVLKKKQFETTLAIDYLKVLSCRLREGYNIKDVQVGENTIRITLALAWKFLIQMEYVLITQWPPQHKVTCVLSVEGPYDFLHDITCLAKKPFQSYYRQLMVSRFWTYQKNLSESDKLLVHFNSFYTTPTFYNIPDSLRNGVPLFYISSTTCAPALQLSEFAYPQFAQFWKPVCLLDTNIWQKWMHTHRIGVLLEHDHPFPKHLHLPNSSGRFHIIQCRQTMMALNTQLKDWSSFVLVESHSYIKLLYDENDKPYTFCLIRTTTKPPCLVLRLAFLVGTAGYVRHTVVNNLLQKISRLTFPPRLNEPPKWRVSVLTYPSDSQSKRSFNRTWSDMPCCIILKKPVEKILIRYESLPSNFFQSLLPQQSYNSWSSNKRSATVQSTFGFRPTYTTPWGSSIKMGPEMFNTVARYLMHKRWIWSIQGTPEYPLSLECAARILSTLTKMRLQEGLRFAFSAAGIVNMVKEYDMKLEDADSPEFNISPCVFQYVLFPPVTSLFCVDTEEEPEMSNENITKDSELYLISECWIEPQSGRIAGVEALNGLKYPEIPDKIFEVDQESIIALSTFEHLNLMCQNPNVPSPKEIPQRDLKRLKVTMETEQDIQYVPFSFELAKILLKSRQAELLFSMFNQGLHLNLMHSMASATVDCYDRSNILLYSAICSTFAELHDREVLLADLEAKRIHDQILKRKRSKDHSIKNENQLSPRWKCFVKRISDNHALVTILPASFDDLKMLYASYVRPSNENVDNFISRVPLDEEQICLKRSLGFLECSAGDSVFVNSPTGSSQKEQYQQCIGRKRARVKSGGEPGPASKKPLTRKSSIDNLFRMRAASIDRSLRLQNSQRVKINSGGGSGTTPSAEHSPTHIAMVCTSPVEERLKFSSHTFTFDEMQMQYGSIGLPVYVYDCSLATLTDNLIFRNSSTIEDVFIDSRYTASSSMDEESKSESEHTKTAFPSPSKHRSPEPKIEDSELLPTDKEALNKHCRALEKGFADSFICGLFNSLQAGHFVYRGDAELAFHLCEKIKISIDITEFLKTICRHCKEPMTDEEQSSNVSVNPCTTGTVSSERLLNIHRFIQKRFQNIILSTFLHLVELPGVYYFNVADHHALVEGDFNNQFRSLPDSSKNTSDFEDVDFGSGRPVPSKRSYLTELQYQDSNYCNTSPSNPCNIDNNTINPMPVKKRGCQDIAPLFMYLTCTYTQGEESCNFLVQNIPTCIEMIRENVMEARNESIVEDGNGKITLEFVLLTTGSDLVDRKSSNEADHREEGDQSSCSAAQPKRGEPREGDWLKLHEQQSMDVRKMIEEVEWLLRDEVTSFRWESQHLTESTLSLVANHIEASEGKSTCKVQHVPLGFVRSSNLVGFESFKKRFSNLEVDGFHLKEEGSWFYLSDLINTEDITSGTGLLLRIGSGTNEAKHMVIDNALCTGIDADDYEVVEINERASHKTVRKLSGQEFRQFTSFDTGEPSERKQNTEQCIGGDQNEGASRRLLATPSQLSEISSLLESVITNGEEGYEGDGSDSGDDPDLKSKRSMGRSTKFWILFMLTSEHLKIYFHCRYNEDDLLTYNYAVQLFEKIVKLSRDLKRIVNQDILLHELEGTRHCNVLLEPDFDQEEFGLKATPTRTRHISGDVDSDVFGNDRNLHVLPGFFACPVVWETRFLLHSRLRTGPGKTLVSRGVQTLKSALLVFEVVNRSNLFVYKDAIGSVFYLRLYHTKEVNQQTVVSRGGIRNDDTFWLDSSSEDMRPRSGSTNERELAKLQANKMIEEETTEDIVLLQVHGITPAGLEIKEQLVQSLRNKLDEAVLDILSVTLDRNPHCKLSPEDVHFIQKPNSLPDYTVMCQVSAYVCDWLPAFSYYMHQNLLNFFSLPKYTGTKSEGRFRDYIRPSDISERNIYIYKQNPGDTGSRGIACLVVTLINGALQPISNGCRDMPNTVAFKEKWIFEDFVDLIASVREAALSEGNSEVMVELQVWKQGRINLEILRSNLATAIKFSLWDLATERFYLTAPLSIEDSTTPSPETEARRKGSIKEVATLPFGTREILTSLHERRRSMITTGRQDQTPLDSLRARSVSFSVKSRGVTGQGFEKKSILSAQRGLPGNVSPRRKIDPSFAGLNGFETGDKGFLHPSYDDLRRWFDFGNQLNIPSLRTVSVELCCRHPIELIVRETEKLVSHVMSVMNEIGPKQFWKYNGCYKQFASLGETRNIPNQDVITAHKCCQDFVMFSKNLHKLASPDFSHEHCEFFRDNEEFNPFSRGSQCLIVARNIIHWKACVSSIRADSYAPDGHNSHYKYPPLLASSVEMSYLGFSVNENVRCEAQNKKQSRNPILVSRQKILLMTITSSKILCSFYNWPKESSDRLLDNIRRLSFWINAKSSLLASIYGQKSGLFHNQTIIRNNAIDPGHMNPFVYGGVDLDTFINNQSPPKHPLRVGVSVKKTRISSALFPCLDSFRDVQHHNTIKSHDFSVNNLKFQLMQLKTFTAIKLDGQNYQDVLQRNICSANGEELVMSFKRSARVVHFCMTPVLFFPRWRGEVAATRDNVNGVRKKGSFLSGRRTSFHQIKGEHRSRHHSEASQKSMDGLKAKNKSSIWTLWGTSNSSSEITSINIPHTRVLKDKKADEKWHIILCESFMKEYIQYLQTLAFTPISMKSGSGTVDHRERVRQISGASIVSSTSSLSLGTDSRFTSSENLSRLLREGNSPVQYLQRNLPGGIMLFEVGFCEPFFYTKIFALENNSLIAHDALTFVEECEKVKTLMHLHSFTYDFHLRSIHAYIAGKPSLVKPGYQLTNFLDDFIKYYPKGPSFARNTIHIGMITVQNVSTPSHILYNYILTHEKVYHMKVLSTNMVTERNTETCDEYVLVKAFSKKITYNQDDECQYDEFDFVLLVAYDAPLMIRPYSSDPSVLRLKYYIILISRRDIYPALVEDGQDMDGKLLIVNTPEALSNPRGLGRGRSISMEYAGPKSRKGSMDKSHFDSIEVSQGEPDEFSDPFCDSFSGMKEEQIHYMGYFSSHEQVMQQIIDEQTGEAESVIRTMISQAAIDCRRDLLWQRLLIGEKPDEKHKNRKEDLISRETVGALSYWEFGELLELVQIKSLSAMDTRLTCLLRQPISFYQNLLKLITQGSLHCHRYFVAPDESVHQVALFCQQVDHAVVMLEINFDKRAADLSVIFKQPEVAMQESRDQTLETQVDILSFVDSVINLCCYCAWASLI